MRKPILASMAACLGLAVAGLTPIKAEAQSISCGSDYTVKRGDTLQRITRQAYGPALSYSYLYNANRSVIGANPSLIEVGMTLNIPCRDGQQPAPAQPAAAQPAAASAASTVTGESATAASQQAPAPQVVNVSTAAVDAMPSRRAFRIITGTDWAPFTDHTQEQGGMMTEVMRTALARVVADDQYQIDIVKDWSAHLEPLLSDVAYDFSIAWFKPNCSVLPKLGENSRLRCEKHAWSDPMFEMLTGYFVRTNDPNKPQSHADVMGKTVCRPEAYATYMLEEFDLVEPAIRLFRPVRWEECFQALIDGQVDIVLVSTTVADDMIAQMNIGAQVEEVPQLAYVTTMHAVTSINNPRKEEQLAVINAGLKEIREDGTWFEIVQRHLIAHARKTANN